MDRIDLLSVTDQATRAAALQSGELDVLEIAPLDYVAPLRRNRNIVVGGALQAAIRQPDVMAAMGLPEDLVVPMCGSIYMCNAPGTTDAGTEPLRNAGVERARSLLRESGHRNEPVVILHAQTSALLNPVADPLVSFNCSGASPGWFCDSRMTELLQHYSAAATRSSSVRWRSTDGRPRNTTR